MINYLTRLFLLTALLCAFPDIAQGVWKQGYTARGEWDKEEQIKQCDGWLKQVAEEPQSAAEPSLRTAPSSQRVVSPRHNRLLPSHGGNSHSHTGRWAKGNSFNPLSSLSLLPCRCLCRHRMTATSPRLRYVIALRRLLC